MEIHSPENIRIVHREMIIIPRMFRTISESKVRSVFEENHIGMVYQVTFTKTKNRRFKEARVEFQSWYDSDGVNKLHDKMRTDPTKTSVQIVYDEPHFWIGFIQTNPLDIPKKTMEIERYKRKQLESQIRELKMIYPSIYYEIILNLKANNHSHEEECLLDENENSITIQNTTEWMIESNQDAWEMSELSRKSFELDYEMNLNQWKLKCENLEAQLKQKEEECTQLENVVFDALFSRKL